MIGMWALALAQAEAPRYARYAGLDIVTDCTVEADPSAKFTFSILLSANAGTSIIAPKTGSGIPAQALSFANPDFSITEGPPPLKGTGKNYFMWNAGSTILPDGRKIGFTAAAAIMNGKLSKFDLTLHMVDRDIEAVCGNSRSSRSQSGKKPV